MSDSHLIKGIKNKNQKSLEMIIDKYSNYVSVIVTNIIGYVMSNEDIEEVCTDVFISLWNNTEKIKPTCKNLKPYIAAIARNRSKNRLRTVKKVELPINEDVIIIDNKSTEREILNSELSQIINQCVSELIEPDKEIIIRYYYFYEQIKDIAIGLNLKESTVKTKLLRSRQKLKKMILERGYSYED